MQKHISLITLTINFVLLISTASILVNLHKTTEERQEIVADLAVVNDIKYGLFNIDKWKNIVANAISKKVNELALDTNLNETLRAPVENAMYKLIDNVEKYLIQEKETGNLIQRKAKTVAINFVFDAEKFKKQVPDWTNDVVKQINTPQNRNQITKYLKDKLDDIFNETASVNNYDIYSYLTNKYDIEDYDECVTSLTEKSMLLSTQAWRLTWILIILVVAIILIYFATPLLYSTTNNCLNMKSTYNLYAELHYYILLLSVIVLLMGGLLTPMIDIDARISNVDLLFMGEAIQFKDQVIFFQSKSVLDVVILLMKEGDTQTIGVGILLFTFSIIFPAIKIIFSALTYRFPYLIKKNKILNFFVLESAKWSMADVMVLAIFMSYIGFSSIVGAQLDFISSFDNATILSTHKHTSLQMGFFIFTAYCISGIVFGYVAKAKLIDKC